MASDAPVTVGMVAYLDGRKVLVRTLVDLSTVLVVDAETGEQRSADLEFLSRTPVKLKPVPISDLLSVPAEQLAQAKSRLEAIEPLLKVHRRKNEVEQRAAALGLSASTLYNWLRAYEQTGVLSSLMRQDRKDKGQSRLQADQEKMVMALIEQRFLSSQRITKRKLALDVQAACMDAQIPVPHYNTIMVRLDRIPLFARARARESAKAVRSLSPAAGEFPGADWPLAYVLIDHTPMDIEVVDDVSRLVIGRPWLTLALDGFSRVVVGFHISLDPPSSMSVGLCLSQAMLRKDALVAQAGCENDWPVWGKIGTLHLDNAKEFRGKALARACEEYGIDIQWRPVRRPHFGGMVERMMGTIGKELHALPGTTFSNPQERGDYDSGKTAAFTLAELDCWVTHFIVDVYHQRLHTALGMSPMKKYSEGLLGKGRTKGRGLIPVPADAARIRLDFMPYVERTIQRRGVAVDGIEYYDPVLRSWLGAKDPEEPRRPRLFIFRRDPRDVSRVYFFDPDMREYFAIPYRDRTRPAMSLWELRAAAKAARAEGRGEIDEAAIFRANQRLRHLEETAVTTTRKTRRQAQRRRLHEHAFQDVADGLGAATVTTALGMPVAELPPVAPFDDVAFGEDV